MNVLLISYGTTYLKFTSDLPNKFTEGTDRSLSQIQMPRKRFDSLDKWKKALNFSFKAFVLLIVSVLQPIEIRVFINQQHMHFVGTKKKVFQSTSATEGITSSEPEQERAHNHCL